MFILVNDVHGCEGEELLKGMMNIHIIEMINKNNNSNTNINIYLYSMF